MIYLQSVQRFFFIASLFVLSSIFCLPHAEAQDQEKDWFEVRTNPISILFGSGFFTYELPLSNNFSVSPGVTFILSDDVYSGSFYENATSGIGANINFQGYFKENWRGLHAGAFLRFATFKVREDSYSIYNEKDPGSRFSAGFSLGYKWLAINRMSLDFDAGIGRDAFVDIDGYAHFTIGYRFKKKGDK